MTKRFEQAMRMLRKHDPQVQEEGFGLVLPYAAEHVEELLAEFAREHDDHGLRCWLLELIGEARSAAALPLLVQQLHGDDDSLRDWAVRGLEKLDTTQAREQLWWARSNGLIA